MGKNLGGDVANIVWARQAITKIEETERTLTSLLGPNTAYHAHSGPLHTALRTYEKDQFTAWTNATLSALSDPTTPLSLSLTGRLMDLDYTTGHLQVNYSDALVTLLRHVRVLVPMGFPVPAAIQKVANEGAKYYRHGVVLKQVAHFYNTIEGQMVPSQQGMMLGFALEFERLVKDPHGGGGDKAGKNQGGATQVTWSNPPELEAYIAKLQTAAINLTTLTRTLRAHHNTITNHVLTLLSTPLLTQQQKWKDILAQIRNIIASVPVHHPGITDASTRAWRNHWDHQLYKALEAQYRLGLETLNEGLGVGVAEMKIEMVFKQGKLGFRPPFEEVRARYYREMKKFINIPLAFRGVGNTVGDASAAGGGDKSIFSRMVDANSVSLGTVYRKAETLFQTLLKTLDVFKDWVILGTVPDLDAFVEQALGDDSGDWDINFRMLKQKGKEAEGLPLVLKVDCITVSTAPVKAAIDDHLQRLFDAMVSALRKGVAVHLAAVDAFIAKATETLTKRPQSLDEIGAANAAHSQLSAAKKDVEAHFEAAEIKTRVLKSVAGSSNTIAGVAIDPAAVRARWSKLEMMLESHELMIKEQVDVLRAAIDGRIKAFVTEFEKFAARWKLLKPSADSVRGDETKTGTNNLNNKATTTAEAVTFVKERKVEFLELRKAADQIVTDSAHFGVSPPDFDFVDAVGADITAAEEMWGVYDAYREDMTNLTKEDWISFRARTHLFEDLLSKWTEKIRGREMDAITLHIQQDVDSYREVIPCLKFLRGDNWTTEHWADLFRIIGVPKGVGLSDLTFGHILACKSAIFQRIEEIKELNSRASGEVAIREAIQELDMWGGSATFALTEYQDVKGGQIMLIKEWKETLTQVGDNQSLLQSLKDSPYYKHFADKASIWERKLVDLDDLLRNLNTVQRKWVYLEPIFGRGALPGEQHRFTRIDEDFHGIMASINKDPRVVSILSYPGIKDTLTALVDQLERCQKALNEFLEQKRARFARFYFIGDEDLLEILGQAKNPNVIQAHLKKLFAGVHNVLFNNNTTAIVAMRSLDGETVQLQTPVQITDDVEVWLENFAKEMKSTLKVLLGQCLTVNDIFKFPSQILGVAEYLHFTSNVEVAITQGGFYAQISSDLQEHLEKLTTFDTSAIEDPTDRHVVELKIKSLILDIIHFIDVVRQLQDAKVTSLEDWAWQRQLRFYMTKDDLCVMRMNDAEFSYTYEYQGNPPKLVHTPLTDKCYLTLTQAMASGFGGNPFGPAGTGKTESVKALGVLFGRQVLVFNCDEGIDYKSMGRIFVGLVKCGAWGCFDEFNRLDEAVLSAVSQQIQIIQGALKGKESAVELLGKRVDLDPNSGIFVTLNPAGKGYGGRQKLPDNLKQLFRSVAMTHPDNELISEVILFSEGFKQGKELGTKVVSVFTLCKQLLSVQQHYDWGLRPLKAVLGLAGNLLHEEKRRAPVDAKREAAILIKALRVNTLSKLTFADSQRFNALMQDIFPDIPLEDIHYEALAEAVRETYQELNLVYMESQAHKIFQFYEACRQRMGVVLVGPSGSGKSTLWRVLKIAWQKVGQKLIQHTVNPKAIDRQALLGRMDMDTREWFDGVLTYASRQAVKEPTDVHTWIICDGDVDPEWVESLNSVLDDNRLLTMPNGERIQFGPNVNFIFETHNLKFASPATVSRMGMIYLSDETLDIHALVQAWIGRQPEKTRDVLGGWINDFFYKSVSWILQNSETVVETTKVGLVMNGLSHLVDVTDRTQFLYALIRGLGANLFVEGRLAFANELLKWGNEASPDPKRTLDYFVNKSGRLEMYQLEEPHNLEVSMMQDVDRLPVVETVDVRRAVDMIMPWFQHAQPFLIVGPEGAGKHMLLRHCFSQLKSTAVATIHCSAQTRSSHILQRLNQTCVSAHSTSGRVLRPKDTERLVLYLKDINLPKPDKYETVELVQFLQQLLTYNGFYDPSLEWVSIENIQIVASMNPSSTMGRHKLSTRFTSVIRQCFISYPDRDQLQAVYRILAQPIIASCLPSHKVWSLPKSVQKLASTIVSIYDQTVQKFTVDMYSHYLFTPRDLSRWVIGLSRYQHADAEAGELLNILAYEAQRLLQDRLVGPDARQKFQVILSTVLRTEWNHEASLANAFYTSASITSSATNLTAARGLVRVELDRYVEMITKEIRVYERDYRDLNLCLFPEALEQIARIERVLGQPGGSLLLAGRPGVGRRSAVMIVSHMLGLRLFSPSIGRNYGMKAFGIDLKSVLQTAGVAQDGTVLLLEDYQLIEPAFLESVNSLLSGGEVPGLYSHDELDSILNSLKDQHSEEGFRGTLFEYFVSRVRKNLHIVLAFDCASPSFVPSCEANPALYTRCQIEWMDGWAPESMMSLAKSVFGKNQILNALKDQDNLIKQMMAIHGTCIARGATPKHLVEYVATYERVYCTKRDSFYNKQKYLSGGLKKLNDAAKYVDQLSADARKQEAELAEKQKQADAALKQITDSMVNAAEQKKEMEELSAQLKDEEEKLTKRKQVIEKELADVEPIIRQSREAVGEIRPESLTEIRSLRAPPPAVRDVLEGVLRLMGNLDMSWNSMKGFLGKRTVKDEIMNFDARNITPQLRESVSELLRQKRDSFEEATIKRASVAAAPLAMWVKANIRYSDVLEKIGPLEADLAKLTKSLDASRERVQQLKQALAVVDKTVASLKEDFGGKTREAEVLRSNLERATSTITAAQGLLGKLSDEGKRWGLQVKGIIDELEALPKNALLASAAITYLGGAPEDVRQTLTTEWKKIAGLQTFDLLKVMSTESEQLVWKSQGLPSDALSNENAIVILNNKTTPLLVDPSGQAIEWLKTHLADRKPEVINQHDETFLRAVELAVRFGKTLIVQETREVEPVLYPLLRGDLAKQGPRFVVQLGEKSVDYNESFRLFLVTRRSAFVIPPDATALVAEVNFTVTRAGLAGQLLGVTLKHEKPELEVEKVKLLQKEDELKIQLASLEEELLRELANSEGNILENKSLIASLNETKAKSVTISASLEESHKLQASLDAERDTFTPLSFFGSSLFFVVSDLQKLNPMYQFSLSSFLRLFEQALRSEGSTSKDSRELRIKLLTGMLEKLVYRYVSRSLFKADRQMFALYLIHELRPQLFEAKEWELFSGQIVVAEVDEKGPEPPGWVPVERRGAYKQLQASLPVLFQSLNFSDGEGWSRWIKSRDCDTEFPTGKLSPFQKVLVIQTLRPDRLLTASLDNLAPPPLNMKRLYTEETIPSEPILFITTPGADPSQELKEFAAVEVGVENYYQIAMGQGQGEHAITTLHDCASRGAWLCLQNVHLVIGWLSTLEKELARLSSSSAGTHPKFRLWLTSEAHTKFPVNLLQSCLKITVEAPPGVKKNLQRTYESWTPTFISSGPTYRAQALFALAWFHAVIQERRIYIPQGWTKFYEFSAADLRSCAELVSGMCAGSKPPQWAILHGLLENAIYGGRIDDVHDALKLRTYLGLYFNDDIFTISGRAPTRKLAKGL
ncbi:Cytoplasmic dynein 2 heavy chain 1, partial [Borealophlyctis nickersoniae]